MATIDHEIDRLEGLSTFELRTLWRRQWKQPPPMRLSKDMLNRGLAWKLQEAAFGGLGKLDQRKLAALVKSASSQHSAEGSNDGDARDPAGPTKGRSANAANTAIILREGNRLVREWNGTTHTVLVLAESFEWQGRQYRSLSQIAEAITGAHWSGPRFFGLTKRKAERKVTASNLSVDREPHKIVGSAAGMT
jgi:Protein of unknown function (DUF2924)